MKNNLIILNYVDGIAMRSYSFYTILYICLFCAHNENFWDGCECGEGSHKYNKCKTLIMVVSKIMLPPYHPHMMKEKKNTWFWAKYCAPQDIMKLALRLEFF
jgi:hypothetical protein